MSAVDRAAERPGGIVGEARWPMAGVVLAAMVLTYLLPEDLRLAPRWVLPLIEGLLLVAVVVGDPGQITRRSALLRGLSIGLVAVLVFDALLTTGLLIDDLLKGGPETNSASALLSAGAIVLVSNNIAFSLLFWELDSGGAAAPVHRLPVPGLHQRAEETQARWSRPWGGTRAVTPPSSQGGDARPELADQGGWRDREARR